MPRLSIWLTDPVLSYLWAELDQKHTSAVGVNGLPSMSHWPTHPIQDVVNRLQIEFFGVERPTSPTTEVREFLMSRFEDDLQELLVAVPNPAVLRFW